MTSLNPTTDISAYIQDIFEGALLIARENNLLRSLVTVFDDRSGDNERVNSQYTGVTVNAIGETDDMAGQAFTPSTLATLTPAEYGAQYVMTDRRVATDPFGVQQDAMMDLGLGMATKIDTLLCSTFSSFTGGTVGAAGTAITWGHFFAMLTRLRAQLAPPPYVFVCHPYQWSVLGKAIAPGATVTNSPMIQDETARNFFVSGVSGVDIYTTANIATITGDDAYCGMFSRPALALDMRRAPRIEPERDASRRAWELNLSSVFAYGVWRPVFGITGLFDATAPES